MRSHCLRGRLVKLANASSGYLGLSYRREGGKHLACRCRIERHAVGNHPADPDSGGATRGNSADQGRPRHHADRGRGRFFASINDGVEQIADATRTIRGYRSVTALTIRATPTLSNKWLLPRLGQFLKANPDLEVRLDGTNEPTDFSREAVDIEIRHGDGRWPGLFVEGLAEESFIPVCAPCLVGERSLSARDVLGFRLIHSVKSQAQWPRWLTLARVAPEERWQRVLFDRSHMAIDAAARGMGIALESTLMMQRELADGLLVCPVRDPPDVRIVTQWIACPRESLRHKKVRLFLDWLRTECGSGR